MTFRSENNRKKHRFNGNRSVFIIIFCFILIILLILCNLTIYIFIGTRYSQNWDIETVDSNEKAWDTGCQIGLTPAGNPIIEYKSQFGILMAYGKGDHNWQHENIGGGANPGELSTMIVDNQGNIHLLYSAANKQLIYAIKTEGTWKRQIVDPHVDRSFSLACDENGNPYVVYAKYNYLNYTYQENGNWVKGIIDNVIIDGAIKMVLDSSKYPHILTRGESNNELRYYSWNGSNWSKEIIDVQSYMKGSILDFGIDSNNSPHIVIVDEQNASLKLITKIGNEWDVMTVDTDNVQRGPAIALDKQDMEHIVYYSSNNGLIYCRRDKNSWSIEIIDSSKRAGRFPSIIVDKAGNVHVAYIDRNVWHLNYATTKRSGFFRIIPIGITEYAIFIVASMLIVIITFFSISRLLAWRKKKIENGKGPPGKKPIFFQR